MSICNKSNKINKINKSNKSNKSYKSYKSYKSNDNCINSIKDVIFVMNAFTIQNAFRNFKTKKFMKRIFDCNNDIKQKIKYFIFEDYYYQKLHISISNIIIKRLYKYSYSQLHFLEQLNFNNTSSLLHSQFMNFIHFMTHNIYLIDKYYFILKFYKYTEIVYLYRDIIQTINLLHKIYLIPDFYINMNYHYQIFIQNYIDFFIQYNNNYKPNHILCIPGFENIHYQCDFKNTIQYFPMPNFNSFSQM